LRGLPKPRLLALAVALTAALMALSIAAPASLAVDPSSVFSVHLILIFMTMGLWLFVWALIALGRRNSKRHVRVSFGDTADGLLVTASGDEGWVQAVEAYIRREYATAPVPAGP
jgi:hypothetical protein